MAKAKTEGGELNQMTLVKKSMEELGANAKPQAIQDHIKEKYGRELKKGIISNYKFHIRKNMKDAKKRGRPVGSGVGGGGGTVKIDDVETLRGMVNRLGAEQVKRLIAAVS